MNRPEDIADLEETVIAAIAHIQRLRTALTMERAENNGRIVPANSDCWGTLGLNASRLSRECVHLAIAIDVARGNG